MEATAMLPKRLVNYIHDTGVRALDNLADTGIENSALQRLIGEWKSMSKEQKEQFVDGVATAVIEVIAASALLPLGAKLGRKAVKSAKKAIKRRRKALKKSASSLKKAKKKAKSPKAA